MIEFHLDGSSGVPAYLQIVQQVRQAISLGVLRAGDQLPTVKEVVGALAINPNTVLKAYRELDRAGVVEARRGQGTFVSAGAEGSSERDYAPVRQELVEWLSRARAAGLDDDAIRALVASTLRTRAGREGRRVSVVPALRCEGLGKRYGSSWALRDCTLRVPAGSVTALVGPNGAGKTTLLQLAVGMSAPTVGEIETLGWSARNAAGMVLPRIGFVAQDHPLYRGFTLAEMLKFGQRMNARWDEQLARRRLASLGLELSQRVAKLSGGQQAQVALTLALAKRPELLVARRARGLTRSARSA